MHVFALVRQQIKRCWHVTLPVSQIRCTSPRSCHFLPKNLRLRRKMSRLTLTCALSNIRMIATPSYCSCSRSYMTSKDIIIIIITVIITITMTL